MSSFRPPLPDRASAPAPQRIAKLLARAGIASRREIERMIGEGRVALNGTVLDTPATILASLAGVTVDGNPVETPAPARLFLYHKPSGLLVTERDPAGRATIYDRLPKGLPRLVPVGRLDLNTEGLLLLTTDGELKRQLELPSTGVERAYRARAYGTVSQAQLEELIHGVEIEGVRYGSINANLERRTGANVWIEMILTEGKNREVRRVLEYLGLKVSRLIRTRYGPFVLADLPIGEIGEVRAHDVAAFRRDPTRNPPPERVDNAVDARTGRRGVARVDSLASRKPPVARTTRLTDHKSGGERSPRALQAGTPENKRAARAHNHRLTRSNDSSGRPISTRADRPFAGQGATPLPVGEKPPRVRLRASRPGDAEAPRAMDRRGESKASDQKGLRADHQRKAEKPPRSGAKRPLSTSSGEHRPAASPRFAPRSDSRSRPNSGGAPGRGKR
ncbi:MAG: pseudouridine synthase [Sphingomonas sp.]